ncbi:MAG: sulfatase [Polyangiaceae bacterium]|nr:sulfatase [Polyangiaceae bacterium]
MVTDPQHARSVPNLRRLARISTQFAEARTNGSQTVYSLTTLFAGTYFSQQFWSKGAPDKKTRATPRLFPHADKTVHFPEILKSAGIPTVSYASASWMVNSVGVIRGLSEEKFVRSRKQTYTLAPDLTRAAVKRIASHGEGPLFLYLHYLDPHAPCDRGAARKMKKHPPFNRCLAEIAYVDKHIGRLRRTLEKSGLWERTVFMISSDHGEAFGEHGNTRHSVSLYDELIHVPLLVRAPQVPARVVKEPVSLIDLGPTILDLFGRAPLPQFLGQSLVPFLRGQDPVLTRPIIAEGRLKKSWIFRDGFKLIVDDRVNTTELYDLNSDPKEDHNIFEDHPSAAQRLGTLRRFFRVHGIKRRRYKVPFRR